MTVEVGVFLDRTAYRYVFLGNARFSPFMTSFMQNFVYKIVEANLRLRQKMLWLWKYGKKKEIPYILFFSDYLYCILSSSEISFSSLTIDNFRLYQGYYSQDNKIVNMLLAVMNQIQGIYHFKSLGRKIDFTIVHLELMRGAAFPEHGGEREQLLTEFCKYQVNTKCTFYSPSHVISSNKKDKKQSQFTMKAIYFYSS